MEDVKWIKKCSECYFDKTVLNQGGFKTSVGDLSRHERTEISAAGRARSHQRVAQQINLHAFVKYLFVEALCFWRS